MIFGSGLVEKGVLGDVTFVGAPAQFGGRYAFLEETFDAPGVDEFINSLGLIGDLGVALADVDDFDVGELGEHRDIFVGESFFQARAPRVSGGRARSDAVFVGMLRCGACGDAMTTETATGRGGVRYHYYNCRAFLKGAGCHSRRLSVDALDKWLLSGILDKVFTPDNLREIVLDVKQSTGAWIKEHEARMEALTAEQADIKRRLRRLYETIEAGGQLELADIAPRLRELKARGDAIAQEIAIAQSETAPTVTLSENEVESAAAMFRDLVESCEDPRRVRMFLSRIVRRAVIDGDAVRVEYYPERIVNQNSGSHCVKDWLPNISTMRNACIMLPAYMAKSDKKTSGG